MNIQSERPDELLTIAVLITLLLLVGLVGLFWSTWNRLVLSPTPTPTATDSIRPTETPDVRATQIAVELGTQAAEVARTLLTETPVDNSPNATSPVPGLTTSAALVTTTVTFSPSLSVSPDATFELQTTSTVDQQLVPIVIAGGGAASTRSSTADPTAISDSTTVTPTVSPIDNGSNSSGGTNTPEAILMPIIVNNPALPTLQSPTASPLLPVSTTPAGADSGNETATSTPPPTETPTPPATATPTPLPTATPTPTRFITDVMSGIVRASGADMRRGPSGIYNVVMNLTGNQQVSIEGRDVSGEWIYICCPADNSGGWIRLADAIPVGNLFDGDETPPEGADPNDIRWLRIRAPDPGLSPVPQSFQPAVDIFPLPRYNNANQGRLSVLPAPPLIQPLWPVRPRAARDFRAPVTISEQGVLANSDDGHLYNFSFEVGDQKWRHAYENGAQSSRAAVLSDSFIYTVDEAGFVYSLTDQGASASLNWREQLRTLEPTSQILEPATDITILGPFLYVGARDNNNLYIVGLNRQDGNVLFAEGIDGTVLHYPTIGGQMIYIATDAGLFAKDAARGFTVWSRTDENLTQISAPPIYSAPGVEALAELYVVRRNGDIIALNANTGGDNTNGASSGRELWRVNDGETVTGMALDGSNIYLSGADFIKAFDREEHTREWRVNIFGEVPGGPLVSPTTLLAVTVNGSIVFIEPATGIIQFEASVGTVVTSGFAVTSQHLFLPAPDNTVRAYTNP